MNEKIINRLFQNIKRLFILIVIQVISIGAFSQTQNQTKEIKLQYLNALEVFNVCIKNPAIKYDDNKEYFWYTEFSGIKSTNGGCGGNLLNGNYKMYDEDGNLRVDKNYSLGIEDSNEIRWDSLGNIVSKTTYDKGKMIYWKFLNDEGYWIEHNGPFFEEGTIKKVYTKYGTLIQEIKNLPGFKQHVNIYYEFPSNQLKEEYTTSGLASDYMYGSYKSYYDNGKVEIEGHFYEGEYTNIKVGVWKWYNKNGSIDSEETYKAEVLYWPNGEIKVAGGYIFDNDTNDCSNGNIRR